MGAIGGPSRHTRRTMLAAAVPAGLLLSMTLVWGRTQAAFSGSTTNPASTLTTGTVSLSDDDSGTALFSLSGLKPGNTGTGCIAVSYGGSVTSAVKLYVKPGDATGTLGTYLTFTVEEGSGGSNASCTGFAVSTTDYSGTLSGFTSAKTTYGTGVGAWSPTGASQAKTYRFSYAVPDDNTAANKSAGVLLTWEARST
jgi:hypothetical protein